MEKDNKTFANYIAESVVNQYDEAEIEDIEPLSERILQALEDYFKLTKGKP